MTCDRTSDLLSDYLDGQLAPRQADEVRVHLEDCAPCRASWHSLRRSVRLTAHLGLERCPADLRPTIALALAVEPPARRSVAPARWGLPAAGLAAVACAAALAVFHITPPPTETAAAPPAAARVAGELHDQYALTTSLGTGDGMLVFLSGARPRRSLASALPAEARTP